MSSQTAALESPLYFEDSLGSRLIEQFRANHVQGRNRRFVESPETSDPANVEGETVKAEMPDLLPEAPLLWFESSQEDGQAVSLQKWEGVVLSISQDSFCARLHDLTAINPEEEAEFSIEDVKEDDKDLLQLGAVFYWSIGYFTSRTGQKMRSSIIKFRRLPAWSAKEIKAIEQRACELGRAIGWGYEEPAACTE